MSNHTVRHYARIAVLAFGIVGTIVARVHADGAVLGFVATFVVVAIAWSLIVTIARGG